MQPQPTVVSVRRSRADDAVLADAGGAHERRWAAAPRPARWPSDVRPIHQLRVDHGHASRHMRARLMRRWASFVASASWMRSSRPGTRRVVAGQHGTASVATDLQHVGVELALRVVRPTCSARRTAPAHRSRNLHSQMAASSGVASFLLHDARHRFLLVAHDAPVAERVVQLHRKHHGRVVPRARPQGAMVSAVIAASPDSTTSSRRPASVLAHGTAIAPAVPFCSVRTTVCAGGPPPWLHLLARMSHHGHHTLDACAASTSGQAACPTPS